MDRFISLADVEILEFDELLQILDVPYAYDSENSEVSGDEVSDDELIAELTPVKNYEGTPRDLLNEISSVTRDLFGDTFVENLEADASTSSAGQAEETSQQSVRQNLTVISDTDSEDDIPLATFVRNAPSTTNGTVLQAPTVMPRPNLPSVYNSRSEEDEPLITRIDRLDGIWDEKRRQPKVNNFNQKTGSRENETLATPTDHFLALFPMALIEYIVYQTNLYASQQGKIFTPTTSKEMKCFLAANMMMGITRKPSYRDYWSANVQLRDEYISTIIPLRRFSWLLTNLHLNNNEEMVPRTDPNHDKMFKIRPVVDILSDTFNDYYDPTRHQSIDEAMVKFKGRSSSKQYVPSKPIKRGFKVWVRADFYGYVAQFQVYTGKSDRPEKCLGERVVTHLTRSLVGKSYVIYCDSFFTGIPLFRKLLQDDIYACGTIKKGRKFLPVIPPPAKAPPRGTSVHRSSFTGLSFVQWQDSKPVMLISNHHDSHQLATAKRKNNKGEILEISCPQMVIDYNRYMGGVDKGDQLRQYYHIDRKSRKWWHRLFWYLVDVSICNAFIVFHQREELGCKLTMKEFRLAVVAGLIGAETPPPKGKKPALPVVEKRSYRKVIPLEARMDKAAHMPVPCNRRRCKFCSRKGHQRRTTFKCKYCDVPLCVRCFKAFHMGCITFAHTFYTDSVCAQFSRISYEHILTNNVCAHRTIWQR